MAQERRGEFIFTYAFIKKNVNKCYLYYSLLQIMPENIQFDPYISDQKLVLIGSN